jgi:hypothetical protein
VVNIRRLLTRGRRSTAGSAALVLLTLAPDCSGFMLRGEADQRCPDHPLRVAAREAESLRLIVALAVDTRPEAELDERQVSEQRQRISEAQDRLLQELGGSGVILIRRYDRLPQLALQVSEPALCHLLTSPLVRDLQLDREDVPGATPGAV